MIIPEPHMTTTAKPRGGHDFAGHVRAQAKLRVALGWPVTLLIWLAAWRLGPSPAAIEARGLLTACGILYVAYTLFILYLAYHPWPLTLPQLAMATAILDPLWLTGALALLGEEGQLFICFYVFTTLGFGLRIGPRAMWLCGISSLLGYAGMTWFAAGGAEHSMPLLSNLALLFIIPLYSTPLVRQLHAARTRAERENQVKSQLLANVSHELRTPLTGIVSSAQLIRDESLEASSASRADTILRLSGNLMGEIDNLLDSAKYEAGALSLGKVPFRLDDVVEQIHAMLAPTASAKGIAFVASVDERIREAVEGDPHHLRRILTNIGGNAVKFTEQGKVEMRLFLIDETPESYLLRFSCKDTGIGIPAELHQKIFEPFYQISTGFTRKYGGTGLGMSLTRDVVAMMGGRLTLESTPGQGSLFCFELRMQKARQDTPPETAAAPPVVYGRRILIADDHRTNLMLLKEMLERDRHVVSAAGSGEEALTLLGSEDFDLIFLDFNLGNIDGATVMRIYRFGAEAPAPVFFFTADTTAATALGLKEQGAAGVLTKPVMRQDLRRAIATASCAERAVAGIGHGTDSGKPATLRPAPAGHIDQRVLDEIRDSHEDPNFLIEALSAAVDNIDRCGGTLLAAIDSGEAGLIRERSRALDEAARSVGAVRLSDALGRLMVPGQEDLSATRSEARKEIEGLIQASVSTLRGILLSLTN